MPKSLPSSPRLTPRLVLRPFRRRDVDELVAAVRDSGPELKRWLPWAQGRYGRTDAVRFVRESAAAWTEGRAFDFALRTHEDDEHHLGNVSIWPTSRREQAGEIGYWVRSTDSSMGIATEAAARVLQVGFEELRLHRIVLRIAVGNRASERIAEKLGFTKEGVLRKEVLVNGDWLDHSLWGLLDEEFRVNRSRYAASGWLGAAR